MFNVFYLVALPLDYCLCNTCEWTQWSKCCSCDTNWWHANLSDQSVDSVTHFGDMWITGWICVATPVRQSSSKDISPMRPWGSSATRYPWKSLSFAVESSLNDSWIRSLSRPQLSSHPIYFICWLFLRISIYGGPGPSYTYFTVLDDVLLFCSPRMWTCYLIVLQRVLWISCRLQWCLLCYIFLPKTTIPIDRFSRCMEVFLLLE